MRRALASLIVAALIALAGELPSLHTHAYGDHDHPEHHHGLSAHEHRGAPASPDDGTAHLEGCDPGQHTVSFTIVCATPPHVDASDAELSLPASPNAEPQGAGVVRHTDIRVHSPPSGTQASPRAPPLITHT